jgi:hypothetical protein
MSVWFCVMDRRQDKSVIVWSVTVCCSDAACIELEDLAELYTTSYYRYILHISTL